MGTAPRTCWLLLLTSWLACAPLLAQAVVDKKPGKLLDRQKLVYEVDAEGEHKLTFDVGNARSQFAPGADEVEAELGAADAV